jgi:hypothetical protein
MLKDLEKKWIKTAFFKQNFLIFYHFILEALEAVKKKSLVEENYKNVLGYANTLSGLKIKIEGVFSFLIYKLLMFYVDKRSNHCF